MELAPRHHLVCIDFSYALHIGIFLQCKTLHCKARRTLINMPKNPLTHGPSIGIHSYQNHGWMDSLANEVGIMWTIQKDKHSCCMLLCIRRCKNFQLLQLDVMHNFSKITNWHVCSLDVVSVLHV
jgi:hypothetical protein